MQPLAVVLVVALTVAALVPMILMLSMNEHVQLKSQLANLRAEIRNANRQKSVTISEKAGSLPPLHDVELTLKKVENKLDRLYNYSTNKAKAKMRAKGKRVAVAAMVSRYSSTGKPSKFRDELMLLSQSILEADKDSEWDLQPVALCLEGDVNEAALAEIRAIGFTVITRPLFVTWAEIEEAGTFTEQLKAQVLNEFFEKAFGGVLRDLSKLWGMTLTDYDRVLVMDTDTLILQPMDELFDSSSQYLLSTTMDFGLLEYSNRFPVVQSGFLLFNPAIGIKHADAIKALYIRGKFDDNGWEGSKIGYNWGGTATAGILAYYVMGHLPRSQSPLNEKDHWTANLRWFPPDDVKILYPKLRRQPDAKALSLASDGAAYEIFYDRWNHSRYRGVQYLPLDEYNVLSPEICRPRRGTVTEAIMKIRTIHNTGPFSVLRPGKGNGLLEGDGKARLREYKQDDAHSANYLVEEYIRQACAPLFDFVGVRQTFLMLKAKKRTGLASHVVYY